MRILILVLLIMLLTVTACAAPAAQTVETEPAADSGAGMLSLVANGEDFVRQGFVTKDGWEIQFDHVYVTLADIAAYQTDPPFDASTGDAPVGEAVTIPGPITLDLAAGDADAPPLTIGEIADAPAGHYNALGWRMTPATDGDAAGATIALMGTAVRNDETINFTILDATEYAYNCGEYVGDGRKGIVSDGQASDVEATFHFDHVFGDADAPADDALNVGALGFDPLAALSQDGSIETTTVDLESLLSADEYERLMDTLATLGHVGEGHCFEAVGGYTGHKK